MTVFTKRVSVTYTSPEDQSGTPESPFHDIRFTKTNEMAAIGKTNGLVNVTKPATSNLKFVDQASAEDYLNCVLTAAAEHNVVIVASSITDI